MTLAANGFEIRLLDPARVRFFRLPDQSVAVAVGSDEYYERVRLRRSFPLRERHRMVSVRWKPAENEDEIEIGLIDDTRQLEPQSRAIVDFELKLRYFVPRIQRIVSIQEEFGLQEWEVETSRGARRFSLRHMHENVRTVDEGHVIVIDTDGCRYEIMDVMELDDKSRRLLREYTYVIG